MFSTIQCDGDFNVNIKLPINFKTHEREQAYEKEQKFTGLNTKHPITELHIIF